MLFGLQETNADTMSKVISPSKANENRANRYATVESAEHPKHKTLHPKLNTCEVDIQKLKSLQTSEVESTSSEKDLTPYWTESCAAINSALLLPLWIDSPDSAAKSYNTWSNKTVEKSWFSTIKVTVPKKNSQLTSLQFCMASVAECPDSGDTVPKSKKIQILPTSEQKAILDRWFGASRFFYNQAVEAMANGATTHFKALVPEIFENAPDWHTDIPRQIKVGAIMDACKAVSNAKIKCKQTGEYQKVKFRSRRQPRQTLYLRADTLKENGFYVRKLGDMKLTEPLPAKPQGTGLKADRDHENEVKDSQLIYEHGRYFLCVSYVEKKKPRDPTGKIVALDPGVRTFLTYFTEDGFGWLGHHAINRIQRLCHHLDNLLHRASQVNRPLRRTLRQAANRIRVKIRNLVDELHKKIAHFLCYNFDVILLPTFETKEMCKRGKRKLRKKSVRQMLTLSHFRFKQFLKHKANETGALVIDVDESYTSKTVSWTGEIIETLGGGKVITAKDGTKMDRDLNGARGIFIKNVSRALRVLPSVVTDKQIVFIVFIRYLQVERNRRDCGR